MKPFVQGQVRVYDAASGALLWTHKTIPDSFVGAGDWGDAAVDTSGNVYVRRRIDDRSGRADPSRHDRRLRAVQLLKLDGSTGNLIWKAPAPNSLENPDYTSSPILFNGGGVELVGATKEDGWVSCLPPGQREQG